MMAAEEISQGDFVEATKILNSYILLQPNNHELYFERAICHHRMGNYKESLDDANEAIRLHSDDHNIHYLRGLALTGLSQFPDAVKSFKKAIEVRARQDDSKLSDIFKLLRDATNELNAARRKPITTTVTPNQAGGTTTTTTTTSTTATTNTTTSGNNHPIGQTPEPTPAPDRQKFMNSEPVDSTTDKPSATGQSSASTSNKEDSYSSKYKRLRRDRERARRGTTKLCTIKHSDLEELHKQSNSRSDKRHMRVIAPIDGWLYSGQLSVDESQQGGQDGPEYVVKLDGDSSGSSYLFKKETVLNDVIKEVRVRSVSELRKGARICCYWSRQYKCLSTGVVTSRTFEETKSLVSVKYDNGDLSALPLEDLRLLPPDYPKYMSNCDPLLLAKNDDTPRQDSIMMTLEESTISEQSQETSVTAAPPEENNCGIEYRPWVFEGRPTKKCKRNGRTYRAYPAIRRGDEVLRVGDTAELMPRDESILPFIARIEEFWSTARGEMKVHVQWYYRLAETKGEDIELRDHENALFKTDHKDENDVQSIWRAAKLLSWTDYRKDHLGHVNTPSNGPKIFYLAGDYNPCKYVRHLRPDVTRLH